MSKSTQEAATLDRIRRQVSELHDLAKAEGYLFLAYLLSIAMREVVELVDSDPLDHR